MMLRKFLNLDARIHWLIGYFGLTVLGVAGSLLIGCSDTGYTFLGCFCVLHVIVACIIVYKTNGTLISFAGAMTAFLYLFHTGQLYLYALFPNYQFGGESLVSFVGTELFYRSTIYSVAIITFLVLGMGIAALLKPISIKNQMLKKCMVTCKTFDEDKLKLRIGGIVVTAIALPVHAMVSYQRIQAAAAGNYFDALDVGISGITSEIMAFLVVGITMLMLGYSNKKVVFNGIYIAAVAFYCWTMLSGGRGQQVIAIVYFTLLYIKVVKPSKWVMLLLFALGYVGLMALEVIAQTRDYGVITWDVISNGIRSAGMPLLSALEEFGWTQYTMALTMETIPEKIDFYYGESYIKVWASLLPNIGGIFTEINQEALYHMRFAKNYMGGSIIGELYANFGAFFFIPATCIGVVMGKVSLAFERYFKKGQYLLIPFLSLFMTGAMWWVRDVVATVVRSPIWCAIALVIGYRFVEWLFNKKWRLHK